MIELPQLREPGRVSDIAAIKLYRTPWGVINDEARLEIRLYDHNTGQSWEVTSGALGENELLQVARDALILLGKVKMVRTLNNEIRGRRAWNQIGRLNGNEETGKGSS